MSGAGAGMPPVAIEPPGPEKQTFSPGELARICRVHPETITRWAKEGMPALRTPGGHRRFWRPDLGFLAARGDPQLLTFKDIAVSADVGINSVYRWARNGQLAWVRIPGGHRRVQRPVAAEFLAKRQANLP